LNQGPGGVSQFHPFNTMKSLVLSACLVAVATVAAAELKDPAEVSKEWSKTADKPLAALADTTGLRAMSPNPFAFPQRTFDAEPAWKPKEEPAPFEGRIIRPPDYDPKHIPKGAKPYEFNGKTYWLIPITKEANA
jgi:hypothetical protein